MAKKEKLTLADIYIIQQALRIAGEDGSLDQFATPARQDMLDKKLQRMEKAVR